VLKRDYEGSRTVRSRGALEDRRRALDAPDHQGCVPGRRRFEEFQESLGIARNVLTDRLNRLVDEGVLERVLYNERPERFEYRLTREGAGPPDRARRSAAVGRQVLEREATADRPS
jgi:DNA-binding HxlR family transcriptional regulator